MDIDLSMLCSHLQEDHCFDLKNAVCAFLYLFHFIVRAVWIPGYCFQLIWSWKLIYLLDIMCLITHPDFTWKELKPFSIYNTEKLGKNVCGCYKMLRVFHLVLYLMFKCFGVAISGLSFVCGKSWERCDWAFYSAACKLTKGIVHQSWIFML